MPQNPLNNLVQGLNEELELNQNLFLDHNVKCCQQQQQQHFIPKKKQYIDLRCAGKKDIAQPKLNR